MNIITHIKIKPSIFTEIKYRFINKDFVRIIFMLTVNIDYIGYISRITRHRESCFSRLKKALPLYAMLHFYDTHRHRRRRRVVDCRLPNTAQPMRFSRSRSHRRSRSCAAALKINRNVDIVIVENIHERARGFSGLATLTRCAAAAVPGSRRVGAVRDGHVTRKVR